VHSGLSYVREKFQNTTTKESHYIFCLHKLHEKSGFLLHFEKKIIHLNKAFARKRCTQDRINFAEQKFAEIDGKTFIKYSQ